MPLSGLGLQLNLLLVIGGLVKVRGRTLAPLLRPLTLPVLQEVVAMETYIILPVRSSHALTCPVV
eukprot:9442823-Lingulodinium_polyedra.AAC.1